MELRFIELTGKAVEAGNWGTRTHTRPVDDLGYTNVDRVSIRGFELRLQTCFPVKPKNGACREAARAGS